MLGSYFMAAKASVMLHLSLCALFQISGAACCVESYPIHATSPEYSAEIPGLVEVV